MSAFSSVGLDRFRVALTARADQLLSKLGAAPRRGLSPAELVTDTLAEAVELLRDRSEEPPEGLGPWLDGRLSRLAETRWDAATAEYTEMMACYVRIRWARWNLPDRRVEPGEVVAEAWANALRSRHTFQGTSEGEFVVWLRTITENAGREVGRFHRGLRRDYRREEHSDPEQRDDRFDRAIDNLYQSTPSSNLRKEEFKLRVLAFVERMRPEHREVLVLTLRGLNEAEIAAELAITVSAVIQRQLAGVRAIRTRLLEVEEGT